MINNKEEMMNYHRTRDMINLLNYFEDVSPIRNLTIIKSVEDYKENYELCKTFDSYRNDTIISKPSMKSVEHTGTIKDMTDFIKKVKMIDNDGVLVLFNLTNKPSNRYERYAGISVGVSIGNCIFIDAVGKGFDGREVSKGIACHERFYIPWFELRRCCISNFRDYRTYLIADDEYQISRDERLNFLTSIGLDRDMLLKYIPSTYKEIPDFIWLDIIKNILKKLEKMEDELKSANLDEFAISGHTEGKKYLPWQIFDKSRYYR